MSDEKDLNVVIIDESSVEQFEKELGIRLKDVPPMTAAEEKILERTREFWAGVVDGSIILNYDKLSLVQIRTVTGRMRSDMANLSNSPKPYPYSGMDTGRMSFGNAVFNLPRPGATPPRCSHAIDEVVENCVECGRNDSQGWIPCDKDCKGFLHMDDPYEIEACDECFRFKGEDRDEQARAAHKKECPCDWPSFDWQHASMAWLYDIENFMGDGDSIQSSNATVMRNFIETDGQEFMDNVIPAIYLATQMLDREKVELAKKAIAGLRKLLMEVKEKLHTKELTIKDFSEHEYDPPGRCKEDFSSPTTGW